MSITGCILYKTTMVAGEWRHRWYNQVNCTCFDTCHIPYSSDSWMYDVNDTKWYHHALYKHDNVRRQSRSSIHLVGFPRKRSQPFYFHSKYVLRNLLDKNIFYTKYNADKYALDTMDLCTEWVYSNCQKGGNHRQWITERHTSFVRLMRLLIVWLTLYYKPFSLISNQNKPFDDAFCV